MLWVTTTSPIHAGKLLAAKQQQMREPHRPEHGDPDEAKLDSDRERLLQRIGCQPRRVAGLADGGAHEQLRYRAGAVPHERRVADEAQRLLPEFRARPRQIWLFPGNGWRLSHSAVAWCRRCGEAAHTTAHSTAAAASPPSTALALNCLNPSSTSRTGMMTRDASGTTVTSASARTAMLARKTSASASMPAAAPRRRRRNPSTARNSSTNAQVTNWPVCVAGVLHRHPEVVGQHQGGLRPQRERRGEREHHRARDEIAAHHPEAPIGASETSEEDRNHQQLGKRIQAAEPLGPAHVGQRHIGPRHPEGREHEQRDRHAARRRCDLLQDIARGLGGNERQQHEQDQDARGRARPGQRHRHGDGQAVGNAPEPHASDGESSRWRAHRLLPRIGPS